MHLSAIPKRVFDVLLLPLGAEANELVLGSLSGTQRIIVAAGKVIVGSVYIEDHWMFL